ASSATLNAADGSLNNIAGQGDKFTLPVDFGLVAGGTDNDIMFVPDASVESGVTTVSATIGGKKYTAGIEFDEAYKQGYIYTYTLTLNNSGFAVTKVNVNPWETGADDSAVLQPEKPLSFFLDDVEYYFEEGMTWRQWLESDYNTSGYVLSSHEEDSDYFIYKVNEYGRMEYYITFTNPKTGSNERCKSADDIILDGILYVPGADV
ncbi:MAG: fimbrillin family protein, partial [Bacteroidaceae bacterium]|nr:fimbrillin family protein [Bacteroidaceae bacterium]